MTELTMRQLGWLCELRHWGAQAVISIPKERAVWLVQSGLAERDRVCLVLTPRGRHIAESALRAALEADHG